MNGDIDIYYGLSLLFGWLSLLWTREHEAPTSVAALAIDASVAGTAPARSGSLAPPRTPRRFPGLEANAAPGELHAGSGSLRRRDVPTLQTSFVKKIYESSQMDVQQ